jgi:HK97 family phage major capsid protein
MTTTVPTAPAELEEILSDRTKVEALFKEGTFGQFVKNYADAIKAKDESVATQVREETQRVLAEWLKDNQVDNVKRLNLDPSRPAPKDRGAGYNPKALGAVLDAEFTDTADYLRTIWYNSQSPEASAKRAKIRNDYSSAVPSDGGFLVPESLRSTLLQTSLETSIVRPRAMVVPMESARVPFPTIDSTTNAGSVFGGMIAYWTEEAGALQKSSAKFGRVVLDAKKLTGYSIVPNELFADSITSFEAFLSQKWPLALSFAEDSAFFSGTGVGEPLGFLKADAAVSVAKGGSQAADTITWENVVGMYARMLPSSLGGAVWIANIDTFPQLATMAAPGGTGSGAIWLNNGVEGPPMSILGRPVIFTEKAETLGDAGDLNFVDLSYYLIGDRQQMQMATSEHVEFDTDQTAVRIIQRADGRPWLNSAITPKKGTNTLSPFVKIAARA